MYITCIICVYVVFTFPLRAKEAQFLANLDQQYPPNPETGVWEGELGDGLNVDQGDYAYHNTGGMIAGRVRVILCVLAICRQPCLEIPQAMNARGWTNRGYQVHCLSWACLQKGGLTNNGDRDSGRERMRQFMRENYRQQGAPWPWSKHGDVALAEAVQQFFASWSAEPTITPEQVTLLRDYVVYYINAPGWEENEEQTLAALREEAPQISTLAQLQRWTLTMFTMGIGPF